MNTLVTAGRELATKSPHPYGRAAGVALMAIGGIGMLITGDDTETAEQTADQDLSQTTTDTCTTGNCEDVNCPVMRMCFSDASYRGTPRQASFAAQLEVQEATLNTMSPGQVIRNRAAFVAAGGRDGLLRGNPAAQAARNLAIRNSGISGNLQSQGLAVLHRLDMVAGGNPVGYYAVGDSGINSSIGRQWQDRVARLDAHAQQAQANGCPTMRVDLYASAVCVPPY